MTVLTVQIGQCGNQLGHAFLDTIFKHVRSAKNESFREKLSDMYFEEECQYGNNLLPVIQYGENNKGRKSVVSESNEVMCLNNYIARSILIDMEPKVIEKCLYQSAAEERRDPLESRNVNRSKNKKMQPHGSAGDSEGHHKYVCGMEEYYEPSNNLTKVFSRGRDSEEEEEESMCLPLREKPQTKANSKREYPINTWKYNKRNFIYGLNGSGNNWSYGFNVHAKNICEDFLNLIQKTMESNDSKEGVDNIILFHSLAGGSGSGISSYLSYLLKDEYSSVNLINVCVLPYMFGEISVQSLNSVLCLSSLYDSSDGIVLLENEKFELMCKRMNNENINTEEINKHISLFLTYTLGLPLDFGNVIDSGGSKYTNAMNSILSDLCSHPSYKFLTTRYLPQVFQENMKFEQNTFSMLLKRMHKMVINGRIVDYDGPHGGGGGGGGRYVTAENSLVDPYFVRLSSRDLRRSCAFLKSVHIPLHLRESLSKSYVSVQKNSVFLHRGLKSYSVRNQGGHPPPHESTRGAPPSRIHQGSGTAEGPLASTHFRHNNVVFGSKMILRGELQENINFDLFKHHVLYNHKSLCPMEIYIDESRDFTYNSLAMVSNCLTPVPTLKRILQNAKMLYGTNAYMYQYNSYGVSHDHVHNSLIAMDQVISGYEGLSCEV
ncbi:delta tubulin, putative [Plasmodium knowlesi strain H]|uniref:Tubulin delta chain n=4 Tax=Plasmodium knowlesi TaxID=5850 RepID=A0A5K1V1K6_PLAKH|nr:tubulin delta chain, putative [Plasmodium knowlesi strain H]OTN67447.1 putative Delta tubulin [Plasmodium knowlesi]CAA9987616.1 tubulin delta chain, putative [Plasmodium knowlesi strain H]SBO26984.1 delta tubulin, putative [Plasmodium knowlesi strain H]SBO29253.1 delta tubulin, putative [Plasmodium knowlesi strain H]VVS77090.1 tubulin delta chain, putative [Plasmodium knowlesi strain H]|eukprot:XP_002258616.1 delta tubulin, putative [Plasmodium knowlesi strain H]